MRKLLRTFLIMILVVVVISYCDAPTRSDTRNTAPVITSLIADTSSVVSGGTGTISCTATDADGDTLSYTWSATRGSISGSGSIVTYTAPSTEGTDTVTCVVADGEGGTDDEVVFIQVTSAGNSNPVITSLIADTSSVVSGGTGTISCTATDADGDTLSYTWSATRGSISGSGSIVTYTAPSTEGTDTVTCVVADGEGGTDDEVVFIQVTSAGNSNIQQIYYVGVAGASFEIFSMNYDGAGKTQITSNSTNHSKLQFSPDGTKLYFQTQSSQDIYLAYVDINTAAEQLITSIKAANNFQWYAAYSSYNDYVVYSQDQGDGPSLYRSNLDGSSIMQLTNPWSGDPAVSPDGTKIAYSENGIYVMDSDGTNARKVFIYSIGSNGPTTGPIRFTSDGESIVFPGRSGGNPSEIYRVNIDSTGLVQLTDNDVPDLAPSISPDGTQIVFLRFPAGEIWTGDIYIMDADGSNQTMLTTGAQVRGYEGIEFSPDGTKIVFTSEQDSPNSGRIFIMNVDGSEMTRITDGPYQSMYPRFKPTGN